MKQDLREIAVGLEMLKGFSSGITTRNNKEILVTVGNTLYRMSLEKLEDEIGELDYTHIDKYL